MSIQSMHTIGAEMMILFKEDVLMEAYSKIGILLSENIWGLFVKFFRQAHSFNYPSKILLYETT